MFEFELLQFLSEIIYLCIFNVGIEMLIFLFYDIAQDLFLWAGLSQLLHMWYFVHILFVVKNFLSIGTKFGPLVISALLFEVDIFPGPENFYFFDMMEDISDIDLKQRLLVFIIFRSFWFGLGDKSFLFFKMSFANKFGSFMDDILDTFDGFKINSVLEVN